MPSKAGSRYELDFESQILSSSALLFPICIFTLISGILRGLWKGEPMITSFLDNPWLCFSFFKAQKFSVTISIFSCKKWWISPSPRKWHLWTMISFIIAIKIIYITCAHSESTFFFFFFLFFFFWLHLEACGTSLTGMRDQTCASCCGGTES